MNRDKIVINTIAFLPLLAEGKSQIELLDTVSRLNIKTVEIRREYIKDFPTELTQIASVARSMALQLFYSIPDNLFIEGKLKDLELEQYLAEASMLGAKIVKLSLGNFTGIDDLIRVRLLNLLSGFAGVLTVENDQTESGGKSEKCLAFLQECERKDLNVFFTFDISNWYWVGEEPLTNVAELAKYTRYIHLKDVQLHDFIVKCIPKVTTLDQGVTPWREVLEQLPQDIPIAIEYPCGPNLEEVLGRDISKILEVNINKKRGSNMELKEMVERFRKVGTATISDAVDKVTGIRGYMSCQIRPLFECKIVGPAVTIKEAFALKSEGPTLAIQAMDEEAEGSVLVIGIDDAEEFAVFGGIMGTGAKVNGFEGAVVNGGVRDVNQLKGIGLPVFSRSIVPSSTIGRVITVAQNIPVSCGGVMVYPGDIIVGDADGVIVVPRAKAEEVLLLAEQTEEIERLQMEEIKTLGSIVKAVEKWARL